MGARARGGSGRTIWPWVIAYADPILGRMNTHVPLCFDVHQGYRVFDPQPHDHDVLGHSQGAQKGRKTWWRAA